MLEYPTVLEKGICMKLLPYHIEKQLNHKEKIQCYNRLREYAKKQSLKKSATMSLGQEMMSKFYMFDFYHNLLHIEGI